jgi:tetratricopeptide (TPR) repeat protein
MQDSASFWTDIKKLEEQLANAPESFCFAGLSAVYLKAGLIDDALHVARQGVAKYPGYLAGQRALSLACHAKGLNDEALDALRRITVALPEDVSSQKLLGRLLVEAGDQEAASQVFRIALEFAPEDVECRLQLESLERSAVSGFVSDEDDEEIIEDLEILDESDDGYSETGPRFPEVSHDPLSTVTLAELYVEQGFNHKALEIYRAILVDNPMDQTIKERVAGLEALDAALTESAAECDDAFEDEADDVTAFSAPAEELFQETAPLSSDTLTLPEIRDTCAESVSASCTPEVPQGKADSMLATLDGWLENIRRIKSCR